MERVTSFHKWRKKLKPSTFRSVAEVLSEARGWQVSVAQVIQWETCQVRPSMSTRLVIEHCTEGAVPADSWDKTFDDGHPARHRLNGYPSKKRTPQPATEDRCVPDNVQG